MPAHQRRQHLMNHIPIVPSDDAGAMPQPKMPSAPSRARSSSVNAIPTSAGPNGFLRSRQRGPIDQTQRPAAAMPRVVGVEMGCEVFIPQRMRAATLAIVAQANAIIAEFLDQGFALTLRQLFYQMVARTLLANTINEYKRLGIIVRDGRNGGLIDWDAIEDRVRVVKTHSSWDNPADIIDSAARSYQTDWWKDQRYRPEV